MPIFAHNNIPEFLSLFFHKNVDMTRIILQGCDGDHNASDSNITSVIKLKAPGCRQ